MISHWPIRLKLTICLVLLVVSVAILAFSGFRGVYAYRGLVHSVVRRANEIPLATELVQHVGALHTTLQAAQSTADLTGTSLDVQLLRGEFRHHLAQVGHILDTYRKQLDQNQAIQDHLGDWHRERAAVHQCKQTLSQIRELDQDQIWPLQVEVKLRQLRDAVEQLQRQAGELPSYLKGRMQSFASDVRGQYRTWIALSWLTSVAASALILLLVRLFCHWVFHPLRVLIHGSRRVAAGDFQHHIALDSHDEMAELAQAMNAMTSRFREIRDDLDRQVKQRTKEVVRSEQLASVGFLAAGVAHEINNPLAAIALGAESLERRVHHIIQANDCCPDHQQNEEVQILKDYLRMIQDEAFRCKEITERLLDFSRMGQRQRQDTDLNELIQAVIDMLRHLGRYKGRPIEFTASDRIVLSVNPQEMKQVVLNLATNALDSLGPEGTVQISLRRNGSLIELVVQDDGCGMTEEVREHLFEPFFTRRPDAQGTGLGMSITYRIIQDHGGQIDVHSGGPGCGSTVTVRLPVQPALKEQSHRYQAA